MRPAGLRTSLPRMACLKAIRQVRSHDTAENRQYNGAALPEYTLIKGDIAKL